MFDRGQHTGNFETNPVLFSLKDIQVKPRAILEIGCGAGYRLAVLRGEFGADCYGIDPSTKAIEYGHARYPELVLESGTAKSLPYADNRFDLVIFGFCLYLCDPGDHFRIAWQADRVLQDGGYLVVHDFLAPAPYSNEFVHAAGIRSRKMEWSRMFTWNPAYRLISRRYLEATAVLSFAPDEQVCIDVLRKDRGVAFPSNPYRSGGSNNR